MVELGINGGLKVVLLGFNGGFTVSHGFTRV